MFVGPASLPERRASVSSDLTADNNDIAVQFYL